MAVRIVGGRKVTSPQHRAIQKAVAEAKAKGVTVSETYMGVPTGGVAPATGAVAAVTTTQAAPTEPKVKTEVIGGKEYTIGVGATPEAARAAMQDRLIEQRRVAVDDSQLEAMRRLEEQKRMETRRQEGMSPAFREKYEKALIETGAKPKPTLRERYTGWKERVERKGYDWLKEKAETATIYGGALWGKSGKMYWDYLTQAERKQLDAVSGAKYNILYSKFARRTEERYIKEAEISEAYTKAYKPAEEKLSGEIKTFEGKYEPKFKIAEERRKDIEKGWEEFGVKYGIKEGETVTLEPKVYQEAIKEQEALTKRTDIYEAERKKLKAEYEKEHKIISEKKEKLEEVGTRIGKLQSKVSYPITEFGSRLIKEKKIDIFGEPIKTKDKISIKDFIPEWAGKQWGKILSMPFHIPSQAGKVKAELTPIGMPHYAIEQISGMIKGKEPRLPSEIGTATTMGAGLYALGRRSPFELGAELAATGTAIATTYGISKAIGKGIGKVKVAKLKYQLKRAEIFEQFKGQKYTIGGKTYGMGEVTGYQLAYTPKRPFFLQRLGFSPYGKTKILAETKFHVTIPKTTSPFYRGSIYGKTTAFGRRYPLEVDFVGGRGGEILRTSMRLGKGRYTSAEFLQIGKRGYVRDIIKTPTYRKRIYDIYTLTKESRKGYGKLPKSSFTADELRIMKWRVEKGFLPFEKGEWDLSKPFTIRERYILEKTRMGDVTFVGKDVKVTIPKTTRSLYKGLGEGIRVDVSPSKVIVSTRLDAFKLKYPKIAKAFKTFKTTKETQPFEWIGREPKAQIFQLQKETGVKQIDPSKIKWRPDVRPVSEFAFEEAMKREIFYQRTEPDFALVSIKATEFHPEITRLRTQQREIQRIGEKELLGVTRVPISMEIQKQKQFAKTIPKQISKLTQKQIQKQVQIQKIVPRMATPMPTISPIPPPTPAFQAFAVPMFGETGGGGGRRFRIPSPFKPQRYYAHTLWGLQIGRVLPEIPKGKVFTGAEVRLPAYPAFPKTKRRKKKR